MQTLNAHEAATLLHLNVKHVQGLARTGKLPAVRVGRKWLFPREQIERLLAAAPTAAAPGVTLAPATDGPQIDLSARNRLRGTVTSVRMDGLMAEVTLRIGDQELVSVITSSSARRMALAVGDTAFAVIKSTEVMMGKESAPR